MRARIHAASITALILAATVGLSACGDDAADEVDAMPGDAAGAGGAPGGDSTDAPDEASEPEEEEADDSTEEAPAMPAGAMGQLNQIPDLEFEEITQGTDTTIQAYDQSISITQSYVGEEVPIEVAQQLQPAPPAADQEALEGAETVAAAEGEQFVVAVVKVDDPRWEPAGEKLSGGNESKNVVRVQGNEIPLNLSFAAGDQVTIAVSVPAEPAAEDVTLESLTASVSQEISLVDGTRTASDVEAIYARPEAVEIGDGASWSLDFESNRGAQVHSGELTVAVISPMIPDEGWANPGNVFLGLSLNTQELSFPHIDNTTIRLRLADGTTVQPDNRPRGTEGPFTNTAWFQLPADAETATAEISVDAQLNDDIHVGVVEVPLTFTRES